MHNMHLALNKLNMQPDFKAANLIDINFKAYQRDVIPVSTFGQ